jgi:hypothetical protein
MTPQMLTAVLINIALPELGRWLASRGAGAPLPTDAEMLAELQATTARGIALGETFLRSKGVDPATGARITP